LLQRIAVERITQELLRLLCGINAGNVLRQYSDVIGEIMPPCLSMIGFEQHNPHHEFDVWEHTLRAVDAAPRETILRLAAFLHDIGKPQCFSSDADGIGHFYGHAAKSEEISREIFAKYIRTDKRTEERVLFLVAHHDEPVIPERKILRRRLAKYGEEPLRQLLALNRADIKGQSAVSAGERLAGLDQAESILDGLAGESACTTLRSLEINGGDLMAMGVPKGPMIGSILHQLLSEVCDESLTNSGDTLRNRAAELLEGYNAKK
jgi:tRNA nucleotidyltransferase (CCA-adding enzyme)